MKSESLNTVGGLNIAEVPLKGGGGLSPVTLEQVLKWDLSNYHLERERGRSGFLVEYIKNNKDWQSLQAVKSGRV